MSTVVKEKIAKSAVKRKAGRPALPDNLETWEGRLGSRLRRVRLRRGMTLKATSQATGLPISSISDIERGRTMAVPTLRLLCKALKIKVQKVWPAK